MTTELGLVKIKRALLSVSDKEGIVPLATRLREYDVTIYSTGGTAALLAKNGVEVVDISSYTGFSEMMDGRLKTLHPKVHGGLLGRAGIDDDVMAEHGMVPFDLVVVNLYPFAKTIEKPGVTIPEAIEQIDIGGPAMLRSAAKNYSRVTAVSHPVFYVSLLFALEKYEGHLPLSLRAQLAGSVFADTSAYDNTVQSFFRKVVEPTYSDQ